MYVLTNCKLFYFVIAGIILEKLTKEMGIQPDEQDETNMNSREWNAKIDDDIRTMSDVGEDNWNEGDEMRGMKSELLKKKRARQGWTPQEVKEIHLHFAKHLKTKTVPRKQACLKAIEASSKANGVLQGIGIQ